MAQAQRILSSFCSEIDFIPREFYGGASPVKKLARLAKSMQAVEGIFSQPKSELSETVISSVDGQPDQVVAGLAEIAAELMDLSRLVEEAAWRVSVCRMAQQKRTRLAAQLRLIRGST